MITIGFEFPSPIPGTNDVKIPTEIQHLFAELDQNICYSFEIGPSCKDILESEKPILEHLSNGFKFNF